MSLVNTNWENILPAYLTQAEKERLKGALKQFRGGNSGPFSYNDFYKSNFTAYFMQGDLLAEMRYPAWNDATTEYEKMYFDAIILTNTCDISTENARGLNQKECLLAPMIEVADHIQTLQVKGYQQAKIDNFLKVLKAQEYSNLFYLPPTSTNGKEYFAILDKVFWVTTAEINILIDTISSDRIASLNHYGYYLFLLKLSYHLCRFPEEDTIQL